MPPVHFPLGYKHTRSQMIVWYLWVVGGPLGLAAWWWIDKLSGGTP